MTRRMARTGRTLFVPHACLISLVVLGLAGTTLGQPRDPAPRTDADGIPLPDGALVRLGSARFRFDGGTTGPVAFSPDGRWCAAGGFRGLWDSGDVSVFDTATGRPAHRFRVPDEHHASLIRFLADGKRLAVGTANTMRIGRGALVTLVELAEGKTVGTVNLPGKDWVGLADVTPDGTRVLVNSAERIYLWDAKAGREVWSIACPEHRSARPFTADGKWFAVTAGGKADLHDAATGERVESFPDPGPKFGNLAGSTMSPDGRLAVWVENGDTVAVLDARGDRRVRLLPSENWVARLAFSPDGRYLVGPGGRTQVWDLTAQDDKGPVARPPGATHVGFSTDGKTLALAGDGIVALWSVGDWKAWPVSADPPSPVYQVRFVPDGKRVIGYTNRGWVSWPAGGGPMSRISDDTETPVRFEQLAGVSADGRTAADVVFRPKADGDRTRFALRVTDLETGKDRRVPLEAELTSYFQISPNGRYLVSFGQGVGHGVWDTATGALLHRERPPDRGRVFGITPAPDGKGLAWSVVGLHSDRGAGFPGEPNYNSVTVKDHRTGREWKMDPVPWLELSGGTRFSPDGSRLVVRAWWDVDIAKEGVTVWDTKAGRRLMAWTQDVGAADAVSLAADNRSLLAGSSTGQLALLEVATGGERVSFEQGGRVLSAALHPDGTRAVSSSHGAPVYVWNLLGEPGRWDAAKSDAVWADLASTDAKTAFAAIRKLRANPADAVAFLKDRVKVPTQPTDETVSGWLKGLDAPAFADRERAERALAEAADLIRPKLEAARKGASAEAGPRLDRALKAADTLTPEKLRQVRACEVLEGIGSADAVRVLRAWAAGPAGARLTAEATESLGRLKP